MLQNEHKDFIKEAREEYKKIGYVECPAFSGERIYFNRHGFRHLIWKDKDYREISEQVYRLSLLKYAPYILSNAKEFNDFNKNKVFKYQDNLVNFWSFADVVDNMKIIVVVRELAGKGKHFFSIMTKGKHKSPLRDL